MKKIEHIGIAVRDISAANKTYEALLGTTHYKSETVESEGVETSFFHIGESKIELLAATSEDSVIQKFLDKKGEGLHHIAFLVENIEKEINRLQSEGFTLLNEKPKKGADNKLIAFLHPKSSNGVLVELCQERNSDSDK
ncbi:MAG TPA: methylmalonyl-CoA epimerase [Salinimicrobium sp.]|nr:methylmalonyl-CoA epimerase [Salinimicrobium sp.]